MDTTDDDAGRRSLEVGRTALRRYAAFGDAAAVTWAAASFNTVFHVTSATGAEAALRVGPAERIHPEGTELVEARWMRALRTDAGVPTPQVHDTDDAQPFTRVVDPATGRDRIAMVFEWIPGGVLAGAMTTAAVPRMGALMAVLHDHAATWAPEPRPLAADRVLYWQVEHRLDDVCRTDPLLGAALARASTAVAALWADPPHRPHLLHGDLTPDNVMVRDGTLVPIDFQDLVVGFDVQDLAIALVSLRRFGDADELRRRFRAGYETVRPWPDLGDDLLADLITARRLHQLNLALELQPPGLADHIARARQLITAPRH